MVVLFWLRRPSILIGCHLTSHVHLHAHFSTFSCGQQQYFYYQSSYGQYIFPYSYFKRVLVTLYVGRDPLRINDVQICIVSQLQEVFP